MEQLEIFHYTQLDEVCVPRFSRVWRNCGDEDEGPEWLIFSEDSNNASLVKPEHHESV